MADNKLLNNFYDYLENNPLPSRRRAGASPTTIKGYVQDISVFLRWWKQSFGNELTIPLLRTDPYQLNKKTVQDFLAWLETTMEYKAATILRYAASLRAFSTFLNAAKAIKHDPTIGLRLPVKKKDDPKGLDDAQRARFEAVFQTPWLDKVTKRKRTYETLAPQRLARDRAIAILMLYAGPRVEEAYSLDLDDIEIYPRSGEMHIRKGKNAKERNVSSGETVVVAALTYQGAFPSVPTVEVVNVGGVISIEIVLDDADKPSPTAKHTPEMGNRTNYSEK